MEKESWRRNLRGGILERNHGRGICEEASWRSKLAYKWAIGIDGALHESEIEVRADNASSHGVPYPKEWKNRLGMRTSFGNQAYYV